jgi:rhodanese-related sulfurtransferase
MEDLFKDYGIVSDGMLNVSPGEAFELAKKGAIIVDVREDYLVSFKMLDIRGLIFIPRSRLEMEYASLPEDGFLIFADAVGLRSKEAVTFLKDKGFKHIANMAGGIVDWERDGLPLITDNSQRLSGSCMCQLKPRGRSDSKEVSRKGKRSP